MALYAALFVVLDYAAHTLGIFTMPNGGSLGLGSLAILTAAYHLGWKKGVVVGLLSIPLQYLVSGFWFTPTWPLVGFLLDYVVPFGVYGLAPLFADWKRLKVGVIVTNLIRLASHVVVGTLLWGVPWWGSFTYNAWYMIPTLILGTILVPLILSRLPKRSM
jgi:thiamine transporter